MITQYLSAPLSLLIHKEYIKVKELIAQIPCKQRTTKTIDGTGGKVSVANIIAYQIGWGTLLIRWYEEGIKGKKLEMPGEGFTKWDYVGIAQHFYIKYQFDSCQKQEQEFHNTIQRILAFVETEYQTGNLDKLGIWSWCTLPSGKQWTLHKWVTVNTVTPYKKASTLIKKFIKEL